MLFRSRVVAEGVNRLRSAEFSALVITHHQKLLEYLVPDRVHVMANGQMILSGDIDLARQIDQEGYVHVMKGASTCLK